MTHPDSPAFTFTRTFNPVVTRHRHDGWTPERQCDFIEALGECGCVLDACRRVGMSSESAYALRRRYDAIDFRLAWDAALDYAVRRLSDAALSRAIHGVAVPHYYKGEIVGEHRRFDEGLTRFLLRYRDPLTYAKSWDARPIVDGHPEQEAERLAVATDMIRDDRSRTMYEQEHAAAQAVADAECAAENKRRADAIALREAVARAVIEAEATTAARLAAEAQAGDRGDEAETAAAWAAVDAFRSDVPSTSSTSAGEP